MMRTQIDTVLVFALAIPMVTRAAAVDDGAVVATHGMRSTVSHLAGNGLRGRDNDTPASLRAQRYLIRRLRRLGNPLQTGDRGNDETYTQHFTFGAPAQAGTNLLAVIPGTDLANEYVIVGGHYDHLDTRSDATGHCRAAGTPGGAVCNGATDNATGTAAVLAIGRALRALPTPPRRSVILALWDAEEDGLQGSRYYVANPLVSIAKTVAYVNFDILGATLLPTMRNISFGVGAETGGAVLQGIVQAAIGAQTLDLPALTYLFGQLRSDYASFIGAGVSTVFFSDSTGGCYHTTGDDLAVVNFPKLRQQSAVAFRVMHALANQTTSPTFAPPGPAAVYADAQSIAHVLALGVGDRQYLSAADVATVEQIKTTIDGIVAEGPAAFDDADVSTVLGSAATLIGALTRVPCQAF